MNTSLLQETLKPNTEKASPRDLLQERYRLFGHIPEVVELLEFDQPVDIEHIGTEDGGSLGVTVTRHRTPSHIGRTAHDPSLEGAITIDGTVTKESADKSSPFPMYRVTQVVPGTDMGFMKGHFEIAIAEEGGYRPIALIMQDVFGNGAVVKGSPKTHVPGLFDESRAQLSPQDILELQETGLYVDPTAQAQLTEVQTIMELVIAQKARSNQPILPLGYIASSAS